MSTSRRTTRAPSLKALFNQRGFRLSSVPGLGRGAGEEAQGAQALTALEDSEAAVAEVRVRAVGNVA